MPQAGKVDQSLELAEVVELEEEELLVVNPFRPRSFLHWLSDSKTTAPALTPLPSTRLQERLSTGQWSPSNH